ncbi:MAG: hypothetical protein K5888_04350 [Lachnospiraceae bacterium]|nr:hypothetical protein [Lachnospiraceae bacterium]
MNYSKKDKRRIVLDVLVTIIIAIILACCVGTLICFGSVYAGLSRDWFFFEKNTHLTFLAISYQVIFLTTSLLSLLSDKEETVYWERFTEYVLVYPRHMNFIGLSSVGFVTLLMQTLSCFFSDHLWWSGFFYANFLIGIIVIIILYYKMSSVYFNRPHYVRILRKTKITQEELNRLKEHSLIAADRSNGRVVNENMSYLLDKSLEEDGDISSSATDALIAVFDHLYENKQGALIENFFGENLSLIPGSSLLYKEIVFWIMEDVSRVELWHAFIKAKGNVTEYKNMLDCVKSYIRDVWSSLPIRFKEGSEHFMRQAEFYEDSRDATIEVRHIFSEYERKITKMVSFVFNNNLRDEQEDLTEILLTMPDPISFRPLINPLDINNDDIIQRIIKDIKNDDSELADFIYTFDVVANTMAHDVCLDERKKDDIILCLIRTMEEKEHPDIRLENAFNSFLIESVQFDKYYRKKYIKNLAQKASDECDLNAMDTLQAFISYDHWLDESIRSLEEERDDDIDDVSNIENGEEESKDDQDDTGSPLEFWTEIRGEISSGNDCRKDLLESLDEYIDFLKNM